jgi:protein ImuA
MVMENRQERAAALRRHLAQNNSRPNGERRTLGHAAVDICLGGGLKCGALHEVFPAAGADGPAATGFVLGLTARVIGKNKWLLWVQQDFLALECGDIPGTGLFAFGIDPSLLIMAKVPNPAAALRAGAEGLGCDGLGAVIIESWGGAKQFDLVASRRLTLVAAKHGVTTFSLRHGALPAPSTAETRWLLRTAVIPAGADWGIPHFDAELLRNRHGGAGRWVMEWDCDGNFHETDAADHYGGSAAAGHRPLAPETERFRKAI